MNITISIGKWSDEEKVDMRSADGEAGRFQRGNVFFMWSPCLDGRIRFCLNINIRLNSGDEFKQTITLQKAA